MVGRMFPAAVFAVVALAHQSACYVKAPLMASEMGRMGFAGRRGVACSAGKGARQNRVLGLSMQVENFGDSPNDVLKWTQERQTVSKEKSPKLKGKAMGEWQSPISSASAAADTLGISDPNWDGEDLYWLEYRPMEARQVVMRRGADGIVSTVTPEGRQWDVRTITGSPYTVKAGVVYFSNSVDGALYTQFAAFPVDPVPLTPAGGAGFSDPDVDPARERVVCVRAEPSGGSSLVAISLQDSGDDAPLPSPTVVRSSKHMMASPTLAPDLRQLAWVDMAGQPDSQVYVGKLSDAGDVAEERSVATGTSHPAWSNTGALHFAALVDGRWNLMEECADEALIKNMAAGEEVACHGSASPFAFLADGTLLCSLSTVTGESVVKVDPATREAAPVGKKNSISAASGLCVSEGGSACAVIAPRRGLRGLSVLEGQEWSERRAASDTKPRSIYVSEPRSIEFKGEDGLPGRLTLYPPRNDRYDVELGETPPLVMFTSGSVPESSRGGTGFGGSDLDVWFWTSRGFAVALMPRALGASERFAVASASPEKMASHLAAAAKHLADAGDVDADSMVLVGCGEGGSQASAALAKGAPFAALASVWGKGLASGSVSRPFAVIRDKGEEGGAAVHKAAKEAKLLCLDVQLPSRGGGIDKSTALDALLLFTSRSLNINAPLATDLDDEIVKLDNFDPLLPTEARSFVTVDGWDLEMGRESYEIKELGFTPVPHMAYFPEERVDRPTGTDMDQETEEQNPLDQIEWL